MGWPRTKTHEPTRQWHGELPDSLGEEAFAFAAVEMTDVVSLDGRDGIRRVHSTAERAREWQLAHALPASRAS